MLGLILYLSAVLIVIIYIFRYPSVVIAPMLCLFPMEQLAGTLHPFFNQYSVFTNIMVGSLVLLAVMVKILRGQNVLKNYPKQILLVIFLFVYAFVSLQWSPGYQTGVDKWQQSIPYLITIILLMPLVISSDEDLKIGLISLIIFGAFITVLIFNYVQWEDRFIVLDARHNIRGNPLAIGQMAGYVVISAALISFTRQSRVLDIVRWMIVAAGMVLAFKSGSRGQIIGVLFVILLLLPVKYASISANKRILYVLLGVAGIVGAVALGISNSSLEHRWEQSAFEQEGYGRLFSGLRMLELWLSDPIAIFFGLGNSASYELIGFYPHNVPIEILSEEGVVGFILYISIIVITFRSWRRVLAKMKNLNMERTAILIAGGLFFYEVFLSLKQGSLLGTALAFTFSIMILAYEKIISQKFELGDSDDEPDSDNQNIKVSSSGVILKSRVNVLKSSR